MSHISDKNTASLAFYLPLLELKMLFDCAHQILELEPFEELSPAQQLMFNLIEKAPTIDLLLNEKEKFAFDYKIMMNYLEASGIVSDDVDVANDFIKNNFTPYESLLLKRSSGNGFSLYFALVSRLKFNFMQRSKPLDYKTKHNKIVKGYKNSSGVILENEKYYGVYIDTDEETILIFVQGKNHSLQADNYENFLKLTDDIFSADYEYTDDVDVLYPHLELELSPPKEMVVGLSSNSKRLHQMVDFNQFNMLSKIKLDKDGMTVETGATMEVGSRGFSRPKNRYVVEDNVFIFLITEESELINAMYVDKEVFLQD